MVWAAYPNPLMLTDTAALIQSAKYLQLNPFKPIGYSFFIALVHSVIASTWALLVVHTLVRLLATIVFLSVLRRFWQIPKNVVIVLGVLCGLEPLSLISDHTLLSGSLFTSLTLLTFASLLWYLKRPSWQSLVALWVSMALAMLVRHIGVLYFGIALLTILALRPSRWWVHFLCIAIGFTGLASGIARRHKADVGVFALTAFDGWALFGDVAPLMDRNPEYYSQLNPKLRAVYEHFAAFPDSIYDPPRGNNWYRFNLNSPAKQFLYLLHHKRPDVNYQQAYVATNVALRLLSRDIILHRPFAYGFRVYLPNLLRTMWRADVYDMDTRAFNYAGKRHDIISSYYQEDSSTWRARFSLFGKPAHVLPYWVTLWWMAALVGTLFAVVRRGDKTLIALVTTDPVVYLTLTMIVMSVLIAAGHHFHLRYATPNMPILMAAGTMAIARWHRLKEDFRKDPQATE